MEVRPCLRWTAAEHFGPRAVICSPSWPRCLPPSLPGPDPRPRSPQQIPLTAQQIEGFIKGNREISALVAKLEATETPDPKLLDALRCRAQKYGFKDYPDFDQVAETIDIVMEGIDPRTRQFTQPPERIKKEIAAAMAEQADVGGGPQGAAGRAERSAGIGAGGPVSGEYPAGDQVLQPHLCGDAVTVMRRQAIACARADSEFEPSCRALADVMPLQ